MQEILRDPMARTILAAAAIGVTLALFLIARRRKRLSYELSVTRVLSVHEAVKGKVQILFGGEPVRDVALILVDLFNSGNEPIKADDYERPVRFSLGHGTILSAEVVRVKPKNLKLVMTGFERSSVVLEPLLLNAGDSITIKLLVNEFGGEFSVDGRIAGVKEIKRGAVPRGTGLGTALVCLVGLIVILGDQYLMPQRWRGVPSNLALFVIVGSIGVFLREMYDVKRRRWKGEG
jgi:hypothetical protein